MPPFASHQRLVDAGGQLQALFGIGQKTALPLQFLILARVERRRIDLFDLVAQQVDAARGLALGPSAVLPSLPARP